MNLFKPQQNASVRNLVFASAISLLATANIANAATIFESGTLGPAGIPQGSVAATNVNTNVYTGVRFHLTQPVVTTQVGGHFVDRSNGTFFGAIVELDDENDFPDSGDLSTPDVLGSTVLTFPVPSDEVFGDLNLSLNPGWYALVFGSGLFDSMGDGAATRNNADIGDATYIGGQPSTPGIWSDITAVFSHHRFVVKGQIVPEPATIVLLSITCFPFLLRSQLYPM